VKGHRVWSEVEAKRMMALLEAGAMIEEMALSDDEVADGEVVLAGVTFRPITADDRDFLCRLYAGTRVEELARTPWSEEEKTAFLAMQFEAQHDHYQKHYPKATFEVIERGGTPIGRFYLDSRDDEFRLIDIALLPEYRGRGIGGAIMRGLLARAEAAGKAVRLHVEHFNPARRLYRRLGFRQLEDHGVYSFMEWRPGASGGEEGG